MLNISSIGTLYVSQTIGNDNYSGFYKEENGYYQGPLKTLEEALKRVGDMRRSGAVQPMHIEILGDYAVSEPVRIGNDVDYVTICSNTGTTIHSGMRITGFREDTFNGVRCFSASVPQVKEGFWFTDFFVDGVRADATTIPKDGFFIPESVENNEEVYNAESKWFIPKKEDLENFRSLRNFSDCRITYYHYWVDAHTPIKSVDFETGKIEMEYRSRFSINGYVDGAIMRYQLENVAEAFENKNEWYLDRETATVYYIPRDDSQTPENICAYAPLSEKLFIVEGSPENQVRGISFSNLTFSYTRGEYASRIMDDPTLKKIAEDEVGYATDAQSVCCAYGAIEFRYAHRCAVENCVVKNVSVHGITVNEGCDNIRIYGNVLCEIGAGAIKINGGTYGCEKSEETWGNLISQNRIYNCGRRYNAGCGVLIMHSYGNTVSHNDISYLYYTGISVGWIWGYAKSITKENLIEKNHVHHIGMGKLSDMGAIYMLGEQPGTVVRNNIVHDVSGFRYGGTGIYTDEGSTAILIEKNIAYNIQCEIYNQHYGRMNVLRNNIAAKGGWPVQASRPELHTAIVAERNIFVAKDKPAYGFGYDHQDTGSGCGTFQTIQGNHNLHFATEGEHKMFTTYNLDKAAKDFTLEEAQKIFGLEEGSVYADPSFCDMEHDDFSLQPESPAYALGFQDIDTSDVGVTISLKEA